MQKQNNTGEQAGRNTVDSEVLFPDSDKKLFISWSKDISREIAIELEQFIETVSSDFNVFSSTKHLQKGTRLIGEIESYLENSYCGIFIVTPQNLRSEWLHYELGYLRSRGVKTVPLLFGVSKNELSDLFSNLTFVIFGKENFWKLLEEIHTNLRQARKAAIETAKRRYEHSYDKYEEGINKILSGQDDLWSTNLFGRLFSKHNLNRENANKEYGVYSVIPEKNFHEIRREILSEPTESLIIVGSSLYEAFSSSTQTPNVKNIDKIISDKITREDSGLKSLKICMSDPQLFDEPYGYKSNVDKVERPPKRIKDTLNNLVVLLNKDLKQDLSVEIYFIPLFQLDHIVLTDDFVLSRSTMLWVSQDVTEEKLIKGPYFAGYKTAADYSLYNSFKRYLDKLLANCTEVDLSKKYNTDLAREINSEATDIHLSFRNDLIGLNNQNIRLYKLYESQLKSSIRSTWLRRFRNIFREEGYKNKLEIFSGNNNFDLSVYKSKPLITDNYTQRILLPYLQETEDLLNEVVKKYDKDGFAYIIPSFDLGVPNNIQRLAGGFATGSIVLWNCGTPIIPIDATVNICSSSVYEFDADISKSLDAIFFETLKERANTQGFVYNFESSNHFIIFGVDNVTGKYYLVLHSSAKEHKYGAVGLYPNSKSWYASKVKTIYNKTKSRYFRYIKDDDAIQFYKIVKSIDEHNIDIHNWVASQIAEKFGCRILHRQTHHHYGMPTCYAINIGTFLLNDNCAVPVFSNRGANIAMVKPDENNIKLLINGKQCSIVPHGWGQDFKEPIEAIKLADMSGEQKKLILGSTERLIIEKASLADLVNVRHFADQHEFRRKLNGQYSGYSIQFEITPLAGIDKNGFYNNAGNA